MTVGLEADQFWRETPRTIQIIMRGVGERQLREYEKLAWHAKFAGLYAQMDPKKAPKIEELVPRKPKKMSPAAIDSAMKAWASVAKRRFEG